ncbi:SPFH domain-containing protein [Luxibacter massiliensis]|uniref:SPFH domain-containing protein n=1 Tax=Luxibacter massiliensis TaxID=2219695 RepID=UPI000F05A029|nr:SPFH domain-containing protein [Luxibacter massiliensis]
MALFGKNPNEVAYTGGKKHWADVIKNTGPGELLIWRQPEEDFNTNSTLVVMPGEEAIFIKGGNIEQVFDNGTYKLSTENYPFISRLRNAFTGGVSTFNCVVYFVRKADSQEIRWGTETPIQVRDKVWGIRTDARVRGAYKVRIENPAKLLEKLIGNNVPYQFQEELNKYFESEFQGKIKSAISKFLNGLEQELIGIDAYMDELSEQIEPYIDEVVQDYGLKCVKFSLAGFDIDNSKYDAIDESQIASISKVKLAQGDKGVMDVLGEDWGRQQAASILGDLARNPGAGGVGAMGAGMGMGVAAGSVFGNMANQMFAPMSQQTPQQPAQPSQPTPSGRFAPKGAGTAQGGTQAPAEDPMETLGKLKKMLDAGLIEQAEYDAKKAEVLGRM